MVGRQAGGQGDKHLHSFELLSHTLIRVLPSFCLYSRYLSGGLPRENPPVATASTQSKERLVAVKQALRALGFNKQVLIIAAFSFCRACFI